MNDLLKKIVCVLIITVIICGGTAGLVFADDDPAGSVTVTVKHTEKWERNRCNYNKRCSAEKVRGENVFWPGEKMIVNCVPSGDVSSVTAYIEGNGSAVCDLGQDAEGTYTGVLRDCSGNEKWRKVKSNLNITVEVRLNDGTVVKNSSPVVIDGTEPYWRTHRIY